MKAEESQTQEQLESLSLELQALRRSFSSTDRMAAQQLTVAKDKLHSLHSTIEKIHQERAAVRHRADYLRSFGTKISVREVH